MSDTEKHNADGTDGADAPDAGDEAAELSPAARQRLQSGLFQRLRTARAALTVIRGYSFMGLLLATALGALSFFYYEVELPRWISRVGAMGCLLGAVVGLNVMDRLVRGRSLPIGMVATGMALIAVALLGVGVGAVRYKLGAAWAPLTAACYVIVGVRIMLRFRNPS